MFCCPRPRLPSLPPPPPPPLLLLLLTSVARASMAGCLLSRCMPDCMTFAKVRMEAPQVNNDEAVWAAATAAAASADASSPRSGGGGSSSNNNHNNSGTHFRRHAFRLTYYWRPRIKKMARQLLLVMNRLRAAGGAHCSNALVVPCGC
jgi:hypothetical protein